MNLRRALQHLLGNRGSEPAETEPSAAWAGKRGQMTLAEDMCIGNFVLESGSYVLSQRHEGGASVLVITSLHGRERVEPVATRQFVTRSLVAAEEREDGSLHVRIAQIVQE